MQPVTLKIPIFATANHNMNYPGLNTIFINRLLPAVLIALASCANPMSPTGGPKDTTPPTIIEAEPANQSVNFNSDRVTITFNEFVTLKEVASQLVVSPPMAEQPEFTSRGKSLIMKFKEPLRSNTTYNFFFGNSIVDITESNSLAGFQYTFSTGPILDSLTLGGKLLSSFTNQPVKGAFVMLYDTIYDSIPYKTRPYYLARTGETGEFNLNNLRDGKYLMFALTDINADYIYNLPTEEIAFADSLVRPLAPEIKAKEPDSLSNDTIKPAFKGNPWYNLRQFKESDSIQKLIKVSLARENVLSIVFKYPVKNLRLSALEPLLTGEWNITGYNRSRDTLTVWLPSPGADSLNFIVADSGYTNDTIEMALKPRDKTPGRNKPEDQVQVVPPLSFKHNIISSRIKPDKTVILSFAEPIIKYDFNKIILKHDSIPLVPEFSFEDSIKTRLKISYPWKEGLTYLIRINDSTFTSAFNHFNDSTDIKFSTLTETETCNLKFIVSIPDTVSDYIIQLLGDKEKILDQRIVSNDTTLEFRYLTTGKYKIKVIYDKNRNGQWDTGNYLKQRQPEYVIYHPKELEMRANWTVEEEWAIPVPGNK